MVQHMGSSDLRRTNALKRIQKLLWGNERLLRMTIEAVNENPTVSRSPMPVYQEEENGNLLNINICPLAKGRSGVEEVWRIKYQGSV